MACQGGNHDGEAGPGPGGVMGEEGMETMVDIRHVKGADSIEQAEGHFEDCPQ